MPHAPRSLTRRHSRSLLRHTTRMLGGVHRPPPPNHLALACRALEEALRIGNRLRPFMAEQAQFLEDYLNQKERQAALKKIYGDDPAQRTAQPSPRFPITRMTESQLLKEELALARSRNVIARLKAKLKNR